MPDAVSEWGRITEEALARLRARMGVDIPHDDRYVQDVTRDAVRNFANGLGDGNPLWRDEAYAQGTRWGGIIAPPSFVMALDEAPTIGLPGVGALFAGMDFEWYKAITVGLITTATFKIVDLFEKKSRFAGRAFEQIVETTIRDQSGEPVARHWLHQRRFERGAAHKKGKFQELRQKRYTPEEIRALDEEYEREEVRGATPRYWEDVQPGEELVPVVKGPLTVHDLIAWCMGAGPTLIRAHELDYALRKRKPAFYVPNELGIPTSWLDFHWDLHLSKKMGFPFGSDMANARMAWQTHLLTNWMGDDGFLKAMKLQARQPVSLGDTSWCRGKVSEKHINAGEATVEIELWQTNQWGEETTRGSGTVILPRRES